MATNFVESRIDSVVRFLKESHAVRDKISIARAYAPARDTLKGVTRIGDDCAAIPDDAGGYLLLAGEAIQSQFVADDPWFAGFSAVMVNVNDILAMGGRTIALLDMIWSPDFESIEPVWEGMRAAAGAYAVPIVGGHTTLTRRKEPVYLATSILGRAKNLMTSFDAQPGFQILMAVDLKGSYRGDKPFWNAAVDASPERLRRIGALLPEIAEQGWCGVCKDISNGGVIGTLIMMLDCSKVGARLELDLLPIPPGIEIGKWLISFPSYGFIFAARSPSTPRILDAFARCDIECRVVGEITAGSALELRLDGRSCVFWTGEPGEA